MQSKLENRNLKIAGLLSVGIALLAMFAAYCLLPTAQLPSVSADSYSYTRYPLFGSIIDNPTITIAGATVNTGITPTTGAHRVELQWAFGTVSGTYSTCTVQAKTSWDGTHWLTLGSAASVTVTSNTVNVWSVIEQLGTTSVTTVTPSSAAAYSFGQQTEYTFACTSYGTSAPVVIDAVYK